MLPPGIDAVAAGKLAIQQYDTNGDGQIGGPELDEAPALKASIKNLDANGDKQISGEEITARIEDWQTGRVGKMGLLVLVTRGGRPLEGATVKFVPEKFLGDEIQPAEGVTDELGYADLSVAVDPSDPTDVRGVQCGLYRVEITKQGAKIPAMYNTETGFGQEVANDAENIQEGIEFKLR